VGDDFWWRGVLLSRLLHWMPGRRPVAAILDLRCCCLLMVLLLRGDDWMSMNFVIDVVPMILASWFSGMLSSASSSLLIGVAGVGSNPARL